MLQLSLGNLSLHEQFTLPYGVYKVAKEAETPAALRQNLLGLTLPGDVPPSPGFAGYLAVGDAPSGPYNTLKLPEDFSYLQSGDVVRVDPGAKRIRVIYRAEAPSNSLLLTERCNHYCVMCSQPPKAEDDTQVARDILEAIPLFSKATRELILSGGEPTLVGDLFLQILGQIRGHLPSTAVHVLSNGRTSADRSLAERIGGLKMPDMMFGIPLYSDVPDRHNFIVQAANAFDETIRGILNLKAAGVRVEIRVVLHSYSIPTLRSLARFIATNLTFVDHVAFMGLEAMGFARSNWDDLWIDPRGYQSDLADACRAVARKGIRTSVYNLPLCWLSSEVLPYYVSSISDWKNEYLEACSRCAAASQCGGFFSSNIQKQVTKESLTPFTLESFRRWTRSSASLAPAQ